WPPARGARSKKCGSFRDAWIECPVGERTCAARTCRGARDGVLNLMNMKFIIVIVISGAERCQADGRPPRADGPPNARPTLPRGSSRAAARRGLATAAALRHADLGLLGDPTEELGMNPVGQPELDVASFERAGRGFDLHVRRITIEL